MITWTLNGYSVTLAPDDTDGLDSFVSEHGPGVPSIVSPAPEELPDDEPLATLPDLIAAPAVHVAEVSPAETFSAFGDGNQVVDATAKERIDAMHSELDAAGFSVGVDHGQFFTNGTRMMREGYAVQERRRLDFEPLPLAAESLADAARAVKAEIRRDVTRPARDIAKHLDVKGGALAVDGMVLREQAIRGLFGLTDSLGASYVASLIDRGATGDVEEAAGRLARELARSSAPIKLRVRESLGDVFAAVSPGYAPLDLDALAPMIAREIPSDVRGTVEYDPVSTRWTLRASAWTPVDTAQQAVGEPIEGTVTTRSADNGTSRFRGGGGIVCLRCLNASTYEATDRMGSRIHRGSALPDVRAILRAACRGIDVLSRAWGLARERTVLDADKLASDKWIGDFWAARIKSGAGVLAGVLAGKAETNVDGLTRAFHAERRDPSRVVKADMAHAWTKFIQDQPPSHRPAAERAIGAWIAAT